MAVKIAPDEKILYRSTNSPKDNKDGMVDFKTAMLTPEAPDKGLYVPERIPVIPDSVITEFGNMTYPEVCYHVLRAWFTKEEIPERKLKDMIKKTYTWPINIEGIGKHHFIDFGKGPTLSFKDPGTSGHAMLVEYFKPEGIILASADSTSGDTGPANARAQYKRPVYVFTFFPFNEVSEFQRRQMTTLWENIYVIGILDSEDRKGNFDTCQWIRDSIMADMRNDPRMEKVRWITGNSKSISRFLPQISYWHYIPAKLCEETGAEKVNVYVGFGNAGNFTSALYAKWMGAPIEIIAAASNENNEFPLFIETGTYTPKEKSINCYSSAMNVGNPSNISRIFDPFGGNVDRDGVVHKQPDLERMRKEIKATWVTNEEIKEAIRKAGEYEVTLDPHGANAYWGMLKLLDSDKALLQYPNIFTETAAPVKFPDLIRQELGFDPPLPEHMKDIYQRKERVYKMKPDVRKIKEFILDTLNF